MGLNSGEVVVGKIGDDLRMDYTALGHTASLAARMEQIAEPGKAYLTEHTAKLVKGMFALQYLGRMTVKGVKEPIGVYELGGVRNLRSTFALSPARGFSRVSKRSSLASDFLHVIDNNIERRTGAEVARYPHGFQDRPVVG
jgi:hypothetical protein